MLPMWRIACIGFLSSLMITPEAEQVNQRDDNSVRVKARVVEQGYCRGDARAFTVSLDIEIQIDNLSRTPVYLLWPMVPWVGKVASSLGDAEAGKFLYEQTPTYYPEDETQFERLELKSGKKISKQISYYLIARRNDTVSLSKSVSPGKYAMILVLSPVGRPPARMEGLGTLKRIVTEPFVVEVSANRKLVNCDSGAKAK